MTVDRPEPEHLKLFLSWTLDPAGQTKLDNLVMAQQPRVRAVVVDTVALARQSTKSTYLKDYAFMRELQRVWISLGLCASANFLSVAAREVRPESRKAVTQVGRA